jgi:hypothetical protein
MDWIGIATAKPTKMFGFCLAASARRARSTATCVPSARTRVIRHRVFGVLIRSICIDKARQSARLRIKFPITPEVKPLEPDFRWDTALARVTNNATR